MTAGYLPASVGGTQVHIRSLVRAFEGDHDVRILCRTSDPEDEEYGLRHYTHDGIRVDTINNTFRDARDFSYLYAAPGVDRAFARLLDDWPPDLVHVHHLTCLSTGMLDELARRGIPTVMTLHDFWMVCPRGQRVDTDGDFQDPIDRDHCLDCMRRTWPGFFPDPAHPVGDRAAREVIAAWDDEILRRLRRVDRIIVPSRTYAAFFADWGLDADRIDVIEHGLERDGFADVARTEPADGKLRVGVLGTVIPSKGVHVLLEAAAGLGDAIALHVHGEFVPYHEDDGYRARLEAAIPDDVETTLHGRYEPSRVPEILANLDVLVVPSTWHEAFGITLREGFLAGLPVIAADHGGLGEAIADGRGVGFRPGDAADLRAKLEALIADPQLRERVRGRTEWVRDVAAMADDTMATYEAARAAAAETPASPDDAFREPFAAAVESVTARSRADLLRAAADGLRAVTTRLGVEVDVASLLAALPQNSWPVRDAYATHRTEAGWLRDQCNALEEEIRALRQTIALRDETIASSTAELRYHREEAERRSETIASLERDAEEHRAASDRERAHHAETVEALRAEHDAALARVRDELEREADRTTRVLRDEVGALTTEGERRAEQIRALERENARLAADRAADIEAEVKRCTDALRDEIEAHIAEGERRAEQIRALERESERLTRDLNAEIDAQKAESERRGESIEALRAQVERVEGELTAQLDGLTRERDSLRADFAKACDALDAAAEAKAESDRAMTRIEAHARDLDARLGEALAHADALRSEHDACRDLLRAIAASRAARLTLRGELGRRLKDYRS